MVILGLLRIWLLYGPSVMNVKFFLEHSSFLFFPSVRGLSINVRVHAGCSII